MDHINNLFVSFEHLNCLIDVVEKTGISKDIVKSFDPDGKMIASGYFESYDHLPDTITQGDVAQEFVEVILVAMGVVITSIVIALTTRAAKFERLRNEYIKSVNQLKRTMLSLERIIKYFDNVKDIQYMIDDAPPIVFLSKKEFMLLINYEPKLVNICKKELLTLFKKCEHIIKNNIVASSKDFHDEYLHFFNNVKSVNDRFLNDNLGININIVDGELSLVSDEVDGGKFYSDMDNDKEVSYKNLGWDISDFKMTFDSSNKILSDIVGFESVINDYIRIHKDIINALKVNYSKKVSKDELLEYKNSLEEFYAFIGDIQFFLKSPLVCVSNVISFTEEFVNDIHICLHS